MTGWRQRIAEAANSERRAEKRQRVADAMHELGRRGREEQAIEEAQKAEKAALAMAHWKAERLRRPAQAAWDAGMPVYTWKPQDVLGKNRAEGAAAAIGMKAEGRRMVTEAAVVEILAVGWRVQSVTPNATGDQYLFVRGGSDG